MTVIDASVAVKWFVDEPSSQLARTFLVRPGELTAPGHLLAEVGRGLLRRKRAGDLSVAEAKLALAGLPAIVRLIALEELAILAFEIADACSVTIYDALYVAAAVRSEDVLVTADQRLHAGVQASDWAGRITLLSAIERQEGFYPES